MSERKRLVIIALSIAIVSAGSDSVALYLQYEGTVALQEARLRELAHREVSLIVAGSGEIVRQTSEETALALASFRAAHGRGQRFSETGEVLVASGDRNHAVYVLGDDVDVARLSSIGSLDEPMLRALAGEAGVIRTVSRRGEPVLAAYEPAGQLQLGLVAQMTMREIRAPLLRAIVLSGATALIAIALAVGLFARSSVTLLGRVRDCEAETRAIVDAAADGIINIDHMGKITSFNQAAARLFGYAAGEVIGRSVTILMPEPEASEHDSYLERYVATGQRRVIGAGREVTGRRRDGTTFPIELAVSEVHHEGRSTFTGILRDISERKHAEREIMEVNRQLKESTRRLVEEHTKVIHAEKLASLGVMAAGIAHEINNPLLGVMTCTKALRAGAVEPARRADYFDTVDEGLERIAGIVRDLLDYAKQRPPSSGTFDAAEMLAWCLRLVTPLSRTKRVAVCNRVEHGEIQLLADRSQLSQAVLNVLLNALQAVPRSGMVEISGIRQPARVGVRIRDNGPGIPAAILPRVRDPFFTTKADGEGTGLGLAVTEGILRAHGGSLDIDSGEGRGTVVTLWLPSSGDDHARSLARG